MGGGGTSVKVGFSSDHKHGPLEPLGRFSECGGRGEDLERDLICVGCFNVERHMTKLGHIVKFQNGPKNAQL